MPEDDWSDPSDGRSVRTPRSSEPTAATDGPLSRWGVTPYSVAGDLAAPARPRPSAEEVDRAMQAAATSWSPPVRRTEPVTTDKPANDEPTSAASRPDPDKRELREATQLGTRPNTVLAGFGGVVLTFVTTGLGAIIDILVSSTIGLGTLVGLCVGAFLAALMTRKSDLLSVIVAPPIIYAMYVAISLLLRSTPVTLTSMANSAVSGFPAIALATGIAALVAGVKLLTSKPRERP